MKEIYQTTVTVSGGRNGHAKSEDGLLELDLRIPKEMGGQGGHTNPEQLFAAGYAACFDSALALVLRKEKVETTGESVIKSTVGIFVNENQGYELTVKLSVHIPGVDADRARDIVNKVHQICPYSNAVRGNIDVVLEIV
ncbi:organic hydroperoxide resistance protein [Sphingobacterium sp. MYb382]|uniref:organic hydroperoxide resistance protein n=1 Tax=Sphingobacterium sp. MYb382 TaxID=2745278 RepID=UPI0030B5D4EF